jgi:hypothetical protein
MHHLQLVHATNPFHEVSVVTPIHWALTNGVSGILNSGGSLVMNEQVICASSAITAGNHCEAPRVSTQGRLSSFVKGWEYRLLPTCTDSSHKHLVRKRLDL